MIVRLAPVLLAVGVVATVSGAAWAQAHAGLRCIATPDATCVIQLAERSLPSVSESRLHLVLPSLARAMVYGGQMPRGLELAARIKSPAQQRLVYMAQAHVLFHGGDIPGARAVLEAQNAWASQSVSEAAGWARAAYGRGDTARGDAAVALAQALLQDHQEASGEVLHSATLPGAIAASGDVDGAIAQVRQMPEAEPRVSAALLLVEDIAADHPDRARMLLSDAVDWRAGLEPMLASRSLFAEAWGWLLLDDRDRAMAVIDTQTEPKRRDGTLAFLAFRAGMVGDADTALFLSDSIAAPEARAGALAQCARAAFEAGHKAAAMTCLEAARGPVAALVDRVAQGGLTPELSADIDRTLGVAATAESLAGNDAQVGRIIEASGLYGRGTVDTIIAAHVEAGEYTLAMLLAYQNADALRQTRALSTLALKLAKQPFSGD